MRVCEIGFLQVYIQSEASMPPRLDGDGSPQQEAVPTPYRSEGSNPGPWRLILPPERPSQQLVRCHRCEKGLENHGGRELKSQVEEV